MHDHGDGDPLADPPARDGAARDYRTWLQTVAGRKPSTINVILAAIADFYTRRGLGAPDVRRLDLPQVAPRALDVTRWLRTVERWLNPRDRVIALIPFHAGLRLGEVVALDDIRLSARKWLIIVRMGKGRAAFRSPPVKIRAMWPGWWGTGAPATRSTTTSSIYYVS